MVKCPSCNEEIEDLNVSTDVVTFANFDGKDYQIENHEDWNNLEYHCPKCDKLLFDNEDDSIKFLEGVK